LGLAGLLVAACSGGPSSSATPAAVATSTSSASPTSAVSPTPTAAPIATPAITGLTGRIVFTRAGGQYGDETVFVATIDATNDQRLSDFGLSGGPWATRDGSRILMGAASPDGRYTIAVSKPDGSDRVVLPLPEGTVNLGGGPFAPDGERILREGFDDDHPDLAGLYISDVDGSNVVHITTRHFIPGDWSPDGQRIVVFDNQDTTSDPPAPGALYVLDADGKNLRQLTPAGTTVQCCTNFRWSPDGSMVLFASPDGSLYTIATDGSNLTKVFTDLDGRWAITPTWSPDGSMILFGLDPSANPFAHPPNGLYVIRADGSGLTLVIGGSDFKREPVWLKG
jgi:Tol biopolymer transport system component